MICCLDWARASCPAIRNKAKTKKTKERFIARFYLNCDVGFVLQNRYLIETNHTSCKDNVRVGLP